MSFKDTAALLRAMPGDKRAVEEALAKAKGRQAKVQKMMEERSGVAATPKSLQLEPYVDIMLVLDYRSFELVLCHKVWQGNPSGPRSYLPISQAQRPEPYLAKVEAQTPKRPRSGTSCSRLAFVHFTVHPVLPVHTSMNMYTPVCMQSSA